MTPEFAARWISEYGCNVYVHAADVNLFATQLTRDLKTIRGAQGEGGASDAGKKRKLAAPII